MMNNKHLFNHLFLFSFACFILTNCAIRKDIVPKVPGYPDSFQTEAYSGYLNTSSTSRRLHYIFVQAVSGVNNTDPVTLWLNGGPGCSSLLGFIQQIGPFYLEEGANYKLGDKLIPNPYSWHNISNLLFLEAPAGVGYSVNKDLQYKYNDMNTAKDNFDALLNFFQNYPEYAKNPFWIAGQSYAGKYIPDLSVLIDAYNSKSTTAAQDKINLKGILIGNGVMNMVTLQSSEIDYILDHDFLDPELIAYYEQSCKVDEESAGCQYFKKRFTDNVKEINPFDVYDYCYYNDSFEGKTKQKKQFVSEAYIIQQFARKEKFDSESIKKFKSDANSLNEKPYNSNTCLFLDGIYDYFNAHVKQFHGEDGMQWNGPCVYYLSYFNPNIQAEKITNQYTIELSGSMNQYKQLLQNIEKYHITLYNGDWDSVVPYTDTIKNLEKLQLKQSYVYTPFFVNDQHAGFIQSYSGISFILIKGASHMVPQSRRDVGYFIFQTALQSHGSQKQFMETVLTDI